MEFLESLEVETLLLLAHTETVFYPWRKNKEALQFKKEDRQSVRKKTRGIESNNLERLSGKRTQPVCCDCY